MQFYLTDLILFPAIFQGFIVSGILYLKRKAYDLTGIYLRLLLVSSSIMLIGRMIYDRFPPDWMIQIVLIPDLVIFLYGPCVYLLTKTILISGKKKRSWVHFLPAAVYGAIVLYLFTFGQDVFTSWLSNGGIGRFFFGVESLGLLSNSIYLGISLKIYLSNYKTSKAHLSYDLQSIRFLQIFLLGVFICLVLWSCSFTAIQFFSFQIPLVDYSMIWYSMPFVSYIVGFGLLYYPTVFQYKKEDLSTVKNFRLHTETINKMRSDLVEAMEEKEAYRNEALTLNELAVMIDSTSNNLSWLLNEVYKETFYDFVNRYRCNAFIDAIDRNEHKKMTLLSIAMECGFKSKSTFNKSFKTFFDQTPSAFIRERQQNSSIEKKNTA
ncbi:MAG: AraC family transcriptional regulator [Bacteroidota bacterium]